MLRGSHPHYLHVVTRPRRRFREYRVYRPLSNHLLFSGQYQERHPIVWIPFDEQLIINTFEARTLPTQETRQSLEMLCKNNFFVYSQCAGIRRTHRCRPTRTHYARLDQGIAI